MADEAHKEPTMEEILSSIRKIISEDDAPASEPDAAVLKASDVAVDEADNDDFEDLTLDDVSDNGEVSFGDEFEEEDIFETDTTFEEDDYSAEVDLPVVEESIPEPVEFVAEPEPEVEFAPEPDPEPVVAAEPEPAPPAPEPQPEPAPAPVQTVYTNQEPDMAATAKYDRTVLTDDTTADAAAGALGQLISKMDMGGDNTIEGLVRELLKPMIKDWLDTNLPGIVEQKVEAEVQRIARMAR